MTVPRRVKLVRHGGDLDEYGHDTHPGYTPMMDEGDLVTFTLTDRALAGTAYADTTFGSQDPDLANDGDDATYHLSLAPVAERWLAIDLLDIYSITAFRFKQGSASTERADTWRLESSSDYDTWTTRDSGTFLADTGIRLLSETVTARYWRLYPVTGGTDGWALYTLSIYSGEEIRLPAGSETDVLTVVSGVPTWTTVTATGFVTVVDGGLETVDPHGSAGSTETIDLADGNWHRLTLNAACTVTVVGFTVDSGCSSLVKVTQDGTGGWGVTWDPSILFTGDDQPDLTASAITWFVLWSDEGDSALYGVKVGGGGPDLSAINFLVGTASGDLSAEIAVGTTPGGELGNTWASPTVDTTHSGSSHAATQAAAEATAAAALAAHIALGVGTDHLHINDVTYSGDGSTVAFELPAAPFDAYSVTAYVAGTRTEVTLSGTLLTTMTFGVAPASATDNIKVDLIAAAA